MTCCTAALVPEISVMPSSTASHALSFDGPAPCSGCHPRRSPSRQNPSPEPLILVVCIAWRDARVHDLFNAKGVPCTVYSPFPRHCCCWRQRRYRPMKATSTSRRRLPPRMAARGEAQSEALELVAVAEGNAIAIYLDRFTSNEPIGRAVIEIETPAGPIAARAEAGDVFRIAAPWLEKPGKYDLIVTVTTDRDTDVLPVTLEIPDPATDGGAAPTGERLRQIVLLAGATAAGFGLALVLVAIGRRRKQATAAVVALIALSFWSPMQSRMRVTRTLLPRRNRSDATSRSACPTAACSCPRRRNASSRSAPRSRREGASSAPSSCRAASSPIRMPAAMCRPRSAAGCRRRPADFPRLGTRVSEGDVLAYVTPPMQAIDVSDMRQRQGELDQQISIVERRVARYEPLAPERRGVARPARRGAARTAGPEGPARLARQGAARTGSADRAGRSGIIAEGTPVAGQIAQPNTVIFPDRRSGATVGRGAQLRCAGSGTHRNARRPRQGRSLALTYRGSGFADRNQSIPVHFAIEGDVSRLRVGQFVTVLATHRRGAARHRGAARQPWCAAPTVRTWSTSTSRRSASKPRPVRIEPLDGERVLIATGIRSGKRDRRQGAELLDQVR